LFATHDDVIANSSADGSTNATYSTHTNVNSNFSSIAQDTFAGNYSSYFNHTTNSSYPVFDNNNTGKINVTGQVALMDKICLNYACTAWINETGSYWENGLSFSIFNGSGVVTRGG
jgi:hypothetical protein